MAFSPYSRTWSGFFQQQFRFFDRLFMAAGVRVEDNNNFGMSTTERGSLAYVVKEWGSRLHGSAGSGFRAPTFNDLFFPGFSNPNLTPETSFSWDVGADQKLWGDRITLGVTYFHNKFDNLIACCVPLATFPFATTAQHRPGQEQGRRVRLAGRHPRQPGRHVQLHLHRHREPRHAAGRCRASRTTATTARSPGSRSSGCRCSARSRSHPSQFEPLGNLTNSGHTVVNLGGTWRILERWGHLKALDFTTRIQNVFNEQYQEVRGFPALGINALVGLRATLQ